MFGPRVYLKIGVSSRICICRLKEWVWRGMMLWGREPVGELFLRSLCPFALSDIDPQTVVLSAGVDEIHRAVQFY